MPYSHHRKNHTFFTPLHLLCSHHQTRMGFLFTPCSHHRYFHSFSAPGVQKFTPSFEEEWRSVSGFFLSRRIFSTNFHWKSLGVLLFVVFMKADYIGKIQKRYKITPFCSNHFMKSEQNPKFSDVTREFRSAPGSHFYTWCEYGINLVFWSLNNFKSKYFLTLELLSY